ncbi:MAG TPA: TM2 domain-containing protein [Myxococcota bacterium]|nr:TM2 domain-containing protein [Myxococcota bacterium]
MADVFATSQAGLPGSLQPSPKSSPKSYATAVSLSAVFGFMGVQHFYLGRFAEGILDLGLSAAWVWSFASGEMLLGVVLALLDFAHSLTVTIQLLTGNFKDGRGRVVCYPGQRLTIQRG